MKHSGNKSFFAIAIIVLSGCSSFNVRIIDCDKNLTSSIKKDFENSTLQIKQCLSKYKRTDDLLKYTEILKKPVTITCDPDPKSGVLALAEKTDSVFFPGLRIFTKNYAKHDRSAELPAILAHESIHWMGYDHYQNFDLSYVAEMCCLDHKDDFLNKIGRKSCELFKYKNKEWVDPDYLSSLTKNLSYFGRSFIGLRTSFAAAIYVKQLNFPNEDVFKILESASLAITNGADSNDRALTKYFTDSQAVTQSIVLANMTDSHESAFNQQLLKKYFDNKTTTLKFYRYFSQTLKELIFGSNSDLVLAWKKFKNYEREICSNLEPYQKEALVELANYTYVDLFNKVKARGARSDELRMLAEWTQICGPKKYR